MKQLIQKIKESVDIVEFIGRYVQYNSSKSKPSAGDFWANCPFHQEKTPSFHVLKFEHRFYCFGCHKGGDVITFYMEREGTTYLDSVYALAKQAGITIPDFPLATESDAFNNTKRYFECYALIASFYQKSLFTVEAKQALAYVHSRGFTESTIHNFGLGYAPSEGSKVTQLAKAKGFTDEELKRFGFDPLLKDRFRGRLMVPIYNPKGLCVGFSGRYLGQDKAVAKYINSPETEYFFKSELLYHYHELKSVYAKNETIDAYLRQPVVVVEGFFDSIRLIESGIPSVASMGTALTDRHLHLLWQKTPMPILCFDSDEAGKNALDKAIKIIMPLLKPGFSVLTVALQEGDPDSFIKTKGIAAFESLLHKALPLRDYLFHRYLSNDNAIPETRAVQEKTCLSLINSIQDKSLVALYKNAFYDYKRKIFEHKATLKAFKGVIKRPMLISDSVWDTKEAYIIGYCIVQPWLLYAFQESFAMLSVNNERLKSLQQALLSFAMSVAKDQANHESVLIHLQRLNLKEGLESLLGTYTVKGFGALSWTEQVEEIKELFALNSQGKNELKY